MEQQLLTQEEVAKYLRCSTWAVRQWTKQGKLRAVRVSHKMLRYRREDVDAFLDAHYTGGSA